MGLKGHFVDVLVDVLGSEVLLPGKEYLTLQRGFEKGALKQTVNMQNSSVIMKQSNGFEVGQLGPVNLSGYRNANR
ncbi:MAG: hypothetical protein CVV27_13420 [Candidatus Melainabacteria bacterium HGW-Melainabacteria-1]|nr:MAG: hypothetical protein CVV27_13420 [Candidatus Melainabacteria bacterium HGW-Melainabacteria-1]